METSIKSYAKKKCLARQQKVCYARREFIKNVGTNKNEVFFSII